MHKFKELKVYHKALAFTVKVRAVTKMFPKDEMFGLTSQFKRAADSIVLNIAEGAGNSTNKEFSLFLNYALRSGFECVGCIEIALANSMISENDYTVLLHDVNEIIAMIHGLRKTLL